MWQILFLDLFFLILLRFYMARSKLFNFNFCEYHHLDTGFIIFVIGVYLIYNNLQWWNIAILLIGLFLIVDDIVQHQMQVWNPRYQSIGHKIGRPIYHLINWLKRLL